MTRKKLSRSVVALALAGAVALTGCDTDDDNDGSVPSGDTTPTTAVDDLTTTSVADDATTTTAP